MNEDAILNATEKLIVDRQKKKMGDSYKAYKALKGAMAQKNSFSTAVGEKIEQILDGKRPVHGSHKGSHGGSSHNGGSHHDDSGAKGGAMTQGRGSNEDDKIQAAVDKLRGTPMEMSKVDDAVRRKEYSKVVELLRKEYEKLANTMEEKSKIDREQAVMEYKMKQEGMLKKLVKSVKPDVASNIREVIGKALMSF